STGNTRGSKSILSISMGLSLPTPITDKKNEEGSNDQLKYSVCSMQGWRNNMEDDHAVCLSFSEEHPDWSYFSVFDGHAGAAASLYCASFLLNKIRTKFSEISQNPMELSISDEYLGIDETTPQEIQNLIVALHDAFIHLDADMKTAHAGTDAQIQAGTTALALIVTDHYLIFANCGDSRAILCRDGKYFFGTKDHKPNLQSERNRIIQAGGSVSLDNRVNGNLAVSRALGDFGYKNNDSLKAIEQCVSPEPTITLLLRDTLDEFAVLACDGIWDVMNNDKVAKFVHNRMKVNSNLVEISADLIDACLFLNSRDNMSALIVAFPAAPIPDRKYIEKDKEIETLISEEFNNIVDKEGANMPCYSFVTKISQIDELVESVYFKVKYVMELLDIVSPDRDKSLDYCHPTFNSFPSTIQMFKNYPSDIDSVNHNDFDS
ncbi:hypothetical protein MXB_5506, partial [Myxobolus squamalis]